MSALPPRALLGSYVMCYLPADDCYAFGRVTETKIACLPGWVRIEERPGVDWVRPAESCHVIGAPPQRVRSALYFKQRMGRQS